MSLRAEQSDRLVALFALGVLLWSYPLLALFNRAALWAGIPVLYLYLFGAWALLIALMAAVVNSGRGGESPPGAETGAAALDSAAQRRP